MIEKGENVYWGKKTVWNELSENNKESFRLIIKVCENRIKFNSQLILKHTYQLTLNIILFVSLFILNRWVKWYLVFGVSSGIFIIPIYHSIIGYDSLLIERFALFTFGMKISVIILSLLICIFYFLLGRHIFNLIDLKNAENN